MRCPDCDGPLRKPTRAAKLPLCQVCDAALWSEFKERSDLRKHRYTQGDQGAVARSYRARRFERLMVND